MVGGTSIGAPLAGWVAQGRTAEETKQQAMVAFRELIDVTLPAVSLLNGKRISDAIYSQASTWDIEDFWLPFYCVSTNITTSRPVIHRRGNSARAIRASVSIPGILPPVPEQGELLVDGGVVDNLPIEVMRDMNPFGKVIAIDVAAPTGIRAKVDHGLSVSGWRHLFDKINPFKQADPLPGVGSTIIQSLMVGSTLKRERALEANLADLYINIHVRGVGLLQFEALERAAKIGYEASIGPLTKWLEDHA
jgi:predicted acylesterase/phospholipase RssA